MNVSPAFVANGEASEPRTPCKSAFYDPSVLPEMAVALDAFSGNAVLDTALSAGFTATWIIVSFIGMEFPRPMARTPPFCAQAGNGIQKGLEHPAVMNIGAAQQGSERNTVSVSDDVPFRAEAPTICRVRSCRFTPLLAAMDALSMQAQLQSNRFAPCNRVSSSR